tara:strand:+ start:799 stop:1422 length:624 start_codon:yes stop_codon:yes gene_type:complete
MHLTKEDIFNTSRIKRLNLINSVTGIKPGNLIGSISKNGNSNLAIFSSVVHLGSNPALIGFISRPHERVRRDTLENILETKYYTINHIHSDFIKQAHQTSGKYDKDESEFETCHLTETYLYNFSAPFLKESKIKFGLKLEEVVSIESNNTKLIIGSIQHIYIDDLALDKNGDINLECVKDIGIGGLNNYYSLKKIAHHPYFRVKNQK